MSFKVPKFTFEDLLPAKPAKVANRESVDSNFSDFSKEIKSNFPSPMILSSQAPSPDALTCFRCGHFRAAVNSPNPTQAWGYCSKRNKGRYGVAIACGGVDLT